MTIAIIGAGMAGLACAEALSSRGKTVRMFDKGRGPGGRMSTRRVSTSAGEAFFDHGAQYFTARDSRFAAVVADWEAQGVVAPWPQVSAEAWVGIPGMNAPIKHLAARYDVTWGCRVETFESRANQWALSAQGASLGHYDAVVLAIPAEQVAPLLARHAPDMAAIADATQAEPCWTVMLAFDQPTQTTFDTVRGEGPIGWAARNRSKPMRTGPETWVIQATPEWSLDHLEDEAEDVTAALTRHWAGVFNISSPAPVSATAHRWRYARSGKAGRETLWDNDLKIGVCGDWLLGPRVECAWLSGTALGALMLSEAEK